MGTDGARARERAAGMGAGHHGHTRQQSDWSDDGGGESSSWACERCTESLRDIVGCMTSAKGKAWACMPCQKACTWALGPADAATVTGSGTEGSGKPAPRPVMKRRTQTATNASPRGGEKRKKARTMMEEGDDDDDNVEEVFGVPKAMAEAQRDMLGMLTQMLAQIEEWMAASEAREVMRVERQERHMAVLKAAMLEHLGLKRRRSAWEEERLEMERVHMEVEQQRVDDMWWLGTFA